MSLNLSRDVTLYVSEVGSEFTAADTWEIRVLDGFTFNQGAESTDVTLDEAGSAPARGKKTFNTALNPADFSFSTYMRPYQNGTAHECIEQKLWEGLLNASSGGGSVTEVTGAAGNITFDMSDSNVHELPKLFLLVEFGTGADALRYKLSEAVFGQADIDFDIGGIATIAWSGQASNLEQIAQGQMPGQGGTTATAAPSFASFIKNKLSEVTISRSTNGTQLVSFTGTVGGPNTAIGLASATYDLDVTIDGTALTTFSQAYSATTTLQDIIDDLNVYFVNENAEAEASYFNDGTDGLLVRSKSTGTTSTVLIADVATTGLLLGIDTAAGSYGTHTIDAASAGVASKSYSLPLTGGSITINNNLTFLTPEELGIVNESIGHFTGTRDVSGSMTAYLRTGTSGDTANLQEELLRETEVVTHSFDLDIYIGGQTNVPRVQLSIPQAHLVIPSTDTEDVMSTTIEFSGLPSSLTSTDEMTIAYTAF